jgi:predicted nucleic acid-binding protein
LLSDDQIVAPELVVYEVTNAIWKHEHLLKDLENGKPYLSVFHGLIEAGKITILSPNERVMQESYSIAKRNGITVYDAVFVSLAIKLGLALKSYDRVQIRTLKSENGHESP